jgi:hypothetical protein
MALLLPQSVKRIVEGEPCNYDALKYMRNNNVPIVLVPAIQWVSACTVECTAYKVLYTV